MAEGKIKKLADPSFGFIETEVGQKTFFHAHRLQGVSFDELQEGQRMSFEETHSEKSPQADNVTVA